MAKIFWAKSAARCQSESLLFGLNLYCFPPFRDQLFFKKIKIGRKRKFSQWKRNIHSTFMGPDLRIFDYWRIVFIQQLEDGRLSFRFARELPVRRGLDPG